MMRLNQFDISVMWFSDDANFDFGNENLLRCSTLQTNSKPLLYSPIWYAISLHSNHY